MARASAQPSPQQPTADLFAKKGLVPGIALVIYPVPGIATEPLPTTVEAVFAERVEVLVPIQQRRIRPLRTGSTVEAQFRQGRLTRRFLAEVIGHSPDGAHEYLGAPRFIEIPERRGSFRLEISVIPGLLQRLPPPPAEGEEPGEPQSVTGVIVDLSDGGMCLSSPAPLQRGDRLAITFDIGDLGTLSATVDVLDAVELGEGRRNKRVHCRFAGLPRKDRDRIARYLMRRQIELRANGQL